MKTLITILIIAFIVNCYSQNSEMAKPYILKADSLFAKKDYQHSLEAYNNAIRFDRGDKTLVPKRDTCLHRYIEFKKTTDHTEVANNVIKQLKEKGAELVFDEKDNAISYKNKSGEIKSVNALDSHTKNEILNVNRKDWDNYK